MWKFHKTAKGPLRPNQFTQVIYLRTEQVMNFNSYQMSTVDFYPYRVHMDHAEGSPDRCCLYLWYESVIVLKNDALRVLSFGSL